MNLDVFAVQPEPHSSSVDVDANANHVAVVHLAVVREQRHRL